MSYRVFSFVSIMGYMSLGIYVFSLRILIEFVGLGIWGYLVSFLITNINGRNFFFVRGLELIVSD